MVPTANWAGTLPITPMWDIWVLDVMGPPSPQPLPVSTTAMSAKIWSVNVAPLGTPVVPDVNTTATGRLPSAGSGVGDSSRTRRLAHTEPGPLARATSITSMSMAIPSTMAAVAIARSASAASFTSTVRSGAGRRLLTPAVMAPSLARAPYSTM